ncbi:hypothetical protein [Actinoplanes subglobosus]|uniref:Uncharacterized protein n=1 Tax=Actinoplanes subglobosus TaxID=1547892 RepID=A0ABV8J217_9ACTN
MAEYEVVDPVWDSDLEHMGPVDLDDLGVRPELVRRLRAWNDEYTGIALTGFAFPSAEAESRWRQAGLMLSYELQNELPDIAITYFEDGDPRPLRDRRGP